LNGNNATVELKEKKARLNGKRRFVMGVTFALCYKADESADESKK
jgi:hypothetical protein